ncbi:MAG: rRNA maturation RNase YbeY [Marinilabiliales bacterium]|nr:MAG: rRNA maturation RNase YbeY [Marinilabiliales bacterium]
MISFNTAIEGFKLKNPEKLKSWLQKIIQKEHQKIEGEIVYIFTDDTYLYSINKQFLNHDTFTDIITFDSSVDNDIISGEIYVSIERIKENAQTLQMDFESELARVMVHGILHLIGFKDKTSEEKAIMRVQEDNCLNLLP